MNLHTPKIKNFQIDWNNYDEVSKLGNIIKSRLGEINPNKISRNQKIRNDLDACNAILNTDICKIYDGIDLDETTKYYVYAHLNTMIPIAIGVNGRSTFAATLGMNFFPFYIGKGTDNRCYDFNRNETHRKVKMRLHELDKSISVYKIKENLTELEALMLESKLIDIFGLIPYGGRLTNLDEGMLPEERKLLYSVHLGTLDKYNKHVLTEKR